MYRQRLMPSLKAQTTEDTKEHKLGFAVTANPNFLFYRSPEKA